MAIVFLVRPANNAVAIELSQWGASLHNVKSATGVSISADYASTAATRSAVDTSLPVHSAMFFFGHGAPSKLLGANTDLVDSKNVGFAKSAAIVAIACSSADVLGPVSIKNGVEAYIGFTKKLTWISGDPDRQFQPAICSGPETLMQGRDIGTALATMQNELVSVENYYHSGSGKSSPDAPIGFLSAFWDRSHLVALGNQNFIL
jgi:hypothetical protein